MNTTQDPRSPQRQQRRQRHREWQHRDRQSRAGQKQQLSYKEMERRGLTGGTAR
jgi:hypothetical protein